METRYEVIDQQTGRKVASYGSKTRARNKADHLDLEYGAIRYYVKTVTDNHGQAPEIVPVASQKNL